MTFIISEDEALRDLLKGMTVSDNKSNSRAVGVWFGQPDPETREQAYPFVTLDLIDVSEARERAMAAWGVSPWYYDVETGSADDWSMPMPVPVNLDYQVTTFARQPRHDRQILAQLLGARLPLRFGSLQVVETTVGNNDYATVRRLDMLDIAKRDTVESGKRMFMNMFTVRVSSEIPRPELARLFYKVSSVQVTGKVHQEYPTSLSHPSLTETVNISL